MSQANLPTTCAYCAAPLKRPGARFCAQCGREQPAYPAAPPGAAATLLMPAPQRGTTQILDPGAPSAVLEINEETGVHQAALGTTALLIGRAPDNDIILTSRYVSARHARIEPEGSGHRIVDIGSTNGLLKDGRRLEPNTPMTLKDGDIVRIGDPATGNFVSLTYRNLGVAHVAQAATINQRYQLDSATAPVTIGRGADENVIVLENPQVSRRHAMIEREGSGHVLRDVGSTNGTFVNGQRITRHPLSAGDVIQIGAFKLVYTGTSLDQYDQRGALRIDARGLTRAVQRNGKPRLILKDVSLSIAPREFVALVGGSGTGKSTLLKALCGFAPAESGSVLINGDDFYRNFDAYRSVLGYVPQDDILHRELQVRNALGYTAQFRLPADTAPAEAHQRIERVLDDVDMTTHHSSVIDTLSGGQRKRISIGAELISDPSLFFLDEPTSGLDPGLEKKLMYTLRRLADSGRTVVLVTHATANITQCDHVAFMSDGRMVYFGPPAEAPAFFNVGSGEFADIYSKLEGLADPQDAEHWAIVQNDLKAEYDVRQQAGGADNPPRLAELWEMKFRASPLYQRYVVTRLAQAPNGPVAGSAANTARSPAASNWRQFGILLRRQFDLLLSDRRNLAVLLLQAPLIGLLLMLVAQPDAIVGDDATISEARKVLFMLGIVSVWFGILNAVREIARETPIYRRERLANLRIAPYVAAKLTMLLLLILAQVAVLFGLTALRVTFPVAGVMIPFAVEAYITLVLTALAGAGLGLLLSALASTPDRAITLVPLALIPQILFAGVIFGLGDGLTAQRIVSWFTISRWSMDALGTAANLNELPLQPGMLILPNPLPEYTFSVEHLLINWLILGCFTFITTGMTVLLLQRRDQQI